MFWLATALATPPTATDLVQLRWISGVQRVGEQVYFVSGSHSLDAEEGWTSTAHLMSLKTAGGQPTRLTSGSDGPYGFSPSPSGDRLVFIRDGQMQILPTDGGEALPLDLGDLKPQTVRWSSDGAHLLFGATPEPAVEPEVAHHTGDAHRFEIAERTRLYRIAAAGGTAEELTDGSTSVVDFAEHGGTIALVTAAEANAYSASMEPTLSLWTDGELRTVAETGCIEGPSFSPDGRTLAWVGCTSGLVGDALRLHDLESRKTTTLMDNSDPDRLRLPVDAQRTFGAGHRRCRHREPAVERPGRRCRAQRRPPGGLHRRGRHRSPRQGRRPSSTRCPTTPAGSRPSS